MNRQRGGGSLRTESIPVGGCAMGRSGNEEVAVFNVDGQFFATQNKCTHMGGPLCEGSLWGDIVQCPWHGSEFNVRTGEVVSGPATVPVKTYKVSVQDGIISVAETGSET